MVVANSEEEEKDHFEIHSSESTINDDQCRYCVPSTSRRRSALYSVR